MAIVHVCATPTPPESQDDIAASAMGLLMRDSGAPWWERVQAAASFSLAGWVFYDSVRTPTGPGLLEDAAWRVFDQAAMGGQYQVCVFALSEGAVPPAYVAAAGFMMRRYTTRCVLITMGEGERPTGENGMQLTLMNRGEGGTALVVRESSEFVRNAPSAAFDAVVVCRAGGWGTVYDLRIPKGVNWSEGHNEGVLRVLLQACASDETPVKVFFRGHVSTKTAAAVGTLWPELRREVLFDTMAF